MSLALTTNLLMLLFSLAGLPSTGSRGSAPADSNSSTATDGFNCSSLEQQCLSFFLLATHTPQLRGSSSVSVISWANSILLNLLLLRMNGRSVCSLPSWPIPSNILRSRFIFPLFEPSILTKGSLTLYRTVIVYTVSTAVSCAHRATLRPIVYLSRTASC